MRRTDYRARDGRGQDAAVFAAWMGGMLMGVAIAWLMLAWLTGQGW